MAPPQRLNGIRLDFWLDSARVMKGDSSVADADTPTPTPTRAGRVDDRVVWTQQMGRELLALTAAA
jgi:hypothetical protein